VRPGGHPLAVISYAMWERRFNLDPGIAGRTMALNGTVFTIVGVAARGFQGTKIDEATDIWLPLAELKQVQAWIDDKNRLTQFLHVIGRRKPGVSLDEAQSNANLIYRQWVQDVALSVPSGERPRDMDKARIDLHPMTFGTSSARKNFRDPLLLLAAVAGVVLLIACANLANLTLARATGRRREVALRLALGAGRARLILELMSESLLLALVGGACGIIAGWWGSQLLVNMVSHPRFPMALDLNPNLHVFAFAITVALITGLLFGIVPAVRATRVDPGPALKEGKGTVQSTRSVFSRALVAAQVTLALLLTAGAGLLVRTLLKVEAVEPGFRTAGMYLVELDDSSSSREGKAYAELCRRIQQRVAALPGVGEVSFSQMNFGQGQWRTSIRPASVANASDAPATSNGNRVDNGFFETMNIPIIAGRAFTDGDTLKSEPVIVVNEELARKLYPDGRALGQQVRMGDPKAYRIVGIAKMAHYRNLREQPAKMLYLPSAQADEYGALIVRIDSNSPALLDRIREVIHDEDPSLAIASIDPLGALVDRTLRQEKLLARLAGFLGVAALLLAAIGLYGVLAYSVSQRTSEIGIRMALGAVPRTVEGMILRESMLLVGIGMAIGIPLTLACGRLIQSQLYGLESGDIPTITVASVVLLLVGFGASLLPARAAARLDPLVALRNE
jgi:predicted permease